MSLELPPCPDCGGVLHLEWRLRTTNALLGGSQLKVGVVEWPFLVCQDCPFTEAGKFA